jgi:hypothetical protein
MTWQPIRTPQGAHKRLQTRQWAVAFCLTWIAVPLAALILAFATKEGAGLTHRAFRDAFALLPILYMIALFSLPPLLIGGAMMAITLRIGRGGWATALVIGVAIAPITFRIYSGTLPPHAVSWGAIALLGLAYSGVFWIALRAQAPKVLSP